MENEKIQIRLDTRKARVAQIRTKMDSLQNQIETYNKAMARHAADLQKAEESVAKIEAVIAEVSGAQTELEAVLKERQELGLRLSKDWKPDPNVKGDAQGFWSDPDYIALTQRRDSLLDAIAQAESRVNTIFYGKA